MHSVVLAPSKLFFTHNLLSKDERRRCGARKKRTDVEQDVPVSLVDKHVVSGRQRKWMGGREKPEKNTKMCLTFARESSDISLRDVSEVIIGILQFALKHSA